jgi:hypothetical protein
MNEKTQEFKSLSRLRSAVTHHRIAQRADALDDDFNFVAGLQQARPPASPSRSRRRRSVMAAEMKAMTCGTPKSIS